MDRLNIVVNKLREVREQRHVLLKRFQDELEKEDKEALAAGQDDADIIGEFRGSELNLMSAIKKKLDARYGKLVCITYFIDLYTITMYLN